MSTTSSSFLSFGTSENLALLALLVSGISLLTSLIMGRREKPNIMPCGQQFEDGNILNLVFLNTGDFNVHGLHIEIDGFDNENILEKYQFSDNYLFSIGSKTTFSYGFRFFEFDLSKPTSLRVVFSGNYQTRFWLNLSFKQVIWYTITPVSKSGDKTTFTVHTTSKKSIETLSEKYDSFFAYKDLTKKS